MNKLYKKTRALLLGVFALTQVHAQTHYGQGAGTVGIAHAFFGTDAGKVNIGADNTFLGHEAGFSNIGGNANTYVGKQAGYENPNGINHTMVGQHAGKESKGGMNNTFLGAAAGFSSSASNNTYLGAYAGFDNMNGQSNVFVGAHAGEHSVNASFNAVLGPGAFDFGEGDNNCILGIDAGSQSTGNSNVFLGTQSGRSNKGNENTFVGRESGYSNKEGFFNIFLGSQSGYSSQTGVGNVFLGNKSGYSNINGHQNVFLGYGAGFHNTTGQRNTYLGYGATGNPTLENAAAIGSEAKVTANNCIVLGNKANVGIGISAPAFQLHLSTDAAAKAGSPDWIVASDSRLKKNISDFTDGLDLLKQIRPVWFQYNGQAGIETGEKKFVGIVAQEMEKIAPYTIGKFTYQDSLGNKTEYLDYDANAVTYILINSVKEQQRTIEEKDAKIVSLEHQAQLSEEKIIDLTARLEKLERSLAASGSFQKNGENAGLEQNVPNGFSEQTSIKYFIPHSAKEAVINIYNSSGTQVSSHRITEPGPGELLLSADRYKNGVHVYDLVVDGKSMGSRKMLVE
ncbi:MAG: tail fiber domain-containing protein [Dyadobacter sp.]|uniref:tail fiber domain-containing protein n=1 Tax=Dyadobacter sp. TaxID=1914288 RepID=UPI001B15D2D2|nr:tail fiber domain-containing protein [Dyadobacter sp.]MBO9613768.1 tail fiber domain-containing protein [Dyadobacter sp.]